ncbi:MAG: peptidylprolyl isomerase [Victivallales bacterium]|nr:peptidylprolyl isomerase [Victivallales bacterium]
MFISHFNRYFEKHAKITYLILLIVIIATFVIFVTPGDVFRGDGRRTVKDLGEMYGKKLKVEQMRTEMAKTTLGFWMQYPQFFGRDLGLNDEVLLQQTLTRMRLLHVGHSMGLDKVSDDEVKKAIAASPYFFEDGKFSPEAFKNTMDALQRSMGILPADFDQTIRDNIVIERVQNKATEGVSVSDDEVNAVLAQYQLKCATIKVNSTDSEPTEEELQAFLTTRGSEIPLPETKYALVALFSVNSLRERLAADPELAKLATPDQEELENYFKTNGERLYPGKQLAEVAADITSTLLNEKLGTLARQRASKLASECLAQVENESEADRAERFKSVALKAGATVESSEIAPDSDVVKGLSGNQPALARAIRGLAEVGDVSNMVPGAGYAAVAYLTGKRSSELPNALPEAGEKANDFLRSAIRRIIMREKALAFFESNVKAPYEAYSAKVKDIQEDSSLSPALRQQQIMALEDTIDSQLILKFFVPPTRDFVLMTFAPEAYRDQIPELTEDELKKAYEERKETYQKVKVRLARIFVETAGLEGEALTAKEAKLAQIQQRLEAGEDFEALAKEVSEQANQVDSTLRELDGFSDAIRAAVTNLAAGQVAPVVKDVRGSYLVKVLERQDGRAFPEVAAELKAELTNAAAKHLADEAAAKFAEAANDEWWAVSEKAEVGALDVAALFENLAEGYPAAKLESFTNASPYGGNYPQEVLAKVFSVTDKAPVSSNVVTANASYVVGLTGETPEHLSDPATDTGAYITLLASYRDSVQMEKALSNAQNERDRIIKALADGADFTAAAAPLDFDDLPAVSKNDIVKRSPAVTTIENGKLIQIQDLSSQLDNAQPKMVLAPIRAERSFNNPVSGAFPYQLTVEPVGYQLIYVAGIDEAAAQATPESDREAVRERLLATKKSQVLNEYMAQLEAMSNTKLREFN